MNYKDTQKPVVFKSSGGKGFLRNYQCFSFFLSFFFFCHSVLFLFYFYFNWRLITILWWFLPYIHMNQPWVYMCSLSWPSLQPPSPSHPSGSSQCTGPEHLISCIKPGLAIYFTCGNIHVSMLFSQTIPPLPSPTESKTLFLISVSFAVLHIGLSLLSF